MGNLVASTEQKEAQQFIRQYLTNKTGCVSYGDMVRAVEREFPHHPPHTARKAMLLMLRADIITTTISGEFVSMSNQRA